MHTRLVVAIGVLAVLGALAGCSAAGSLHMQAVDDAGLVDETSRSTDYPGHAPPTDTPPPWEVAREAITNGSTTVLAPSQPLDEGLPFEHEGAYYDVSGTIVGEQEATGARFAVDYNATDTEGDAVAYEDLPAVDREALDALFPPPDRDRVEGPDFGAFAAYTDAELNESVLVPDPQYDVVVYDGERYAVTVEDVETITLHRYEYTATQVAESEAAYAAHLREAYAFELGNLSAGERDVVEEAVDDGAYYADSTDDAAFESVLDRFRAQERIEGDQASGTWVVYYGGDLYVAELYYGQFLGE